VDRASMPVRPSRCTTISPPRTALRTAFILDDGMNPAVEVDAILPWQCSGTELRVP